VCSQPSPCVRVFDHPAFTPAHNQTPTIQHRHHNTAQAQQVQNPASAAPPAPQLQKQPPGPDLPPRRPATPSAPLQPQSGPSPTTAPSAGGVWVPISGPPTREPREIRRMVHLADAAAEEVGLSALTEVATPQRLAIGKREAREQAAALA